MSRSTPRAGSAVLRRPGPTGRTRSGSGQWYRVPLLRAHLLFLLGCCAYIVASYPNAAGPVLLLTGAALLSEAAPQRLRRFFLTEGLLLLGGAASFAWTWEIDRGDDGGVTVIGPDQAFAGWIRMVFVAWLLIPTQPGYLRWIAALAGIELALRARFDEGDGGVRLALLVVTAIVALAWDAHLRVASLRPGEAHLGRVQPAGMLRWNGVPILLVACIALVGGAGIERLVDRHPGRTGGGGATPAASVAFGGLNAAMHLGDNSYVDRDPILTARITADRPLAPGIHYLRALTLPYLVLDDAEGLRWRAAQQARRHLPPMPTLHPGPPTEPVTVYRRADAGDVVLIPDGSARIELYDVVEDADGNLYRPSIGDIHTRYRADLGRASRPAAGRNRIDDGRYRALDDDLADRLHDRLPVLDLWRRMLPRDAAHTVERFLASRCRYRLEDLPAPDGDPTAKLRTFLFDPDPDRRVGHCRYFATAAVLLLRAAGHDARVVIGYASDEVDGNTVDFRAPNAHAWIEVRDRRDGQTFWHRFDPTPPAFLDQRRGGLDSAGLDAMEDDLERQARDANTVARTEARRRHLGYWIGSAVALGLGALIFWHLHRRPAGARRERLLQRQSEQLIALAIDLGVPVDRHTTLTTLIDAVEARSGVDLGEHRRAHLAARFADGPLPPPWPIDALRKRKLATCYS